MNISRETALALLDHGAKLAAMSGHHDGLVRAILGPTNTGKTHLAIERMCAHSSGVIGFPLRLLAREMYDRVVGLKGAAQVALITGEERIVPQHARYFLTTAESMPVPSGAEGPVASDNADRDFAFAAIDEAWKWRGQRRPARAEPPTTRPGNAFAALAGLKR